MTAAPGMRTSTELRSSIVERVAHCLALSAPLCRRYRVSVPKPEIRFDLRGTAAGQCVWQQRRTPVLRFNLKLAEDHYDDFVTTTVAHEVAHLVTIACHRKAPPHGTEWRAVMRHLGIRNPERCHRYVVDTSNQRRQRRWAYVCDCREHHLSTTRHNRVRRDLAEYRCLHCGSRLRPTGDKAEQ